MDEKDKRMNLLVRRMFGYRDEAWEAVLNPELMTLELFKECIAVSVRIDDFDTYMKLSETFPEYMNILFGELEEGCAADGNPEELSPEEVQKGIEKIKEKLK